MLINNPFKKNRTLDKIEPKNNLNSELDGLLDLCKKNLKSYDEKLIIKAYRWCMEAHKNKVRKSGEAYFTHPIAVAKIVISEIPLDDVSVACALLHEIISEGENYSLKDIDSEFGSTIASIIDGITKIKHIEGHNIGHHENYRKLLLSLFTDVRIILIKLADRLHNMRTLDHLPPERQISVANETMEIYAPFAHRFGLGKIKWEFEDLAFKYLNRDAFNEIKEALSLTRDQREQYLKEFIKPLKEALDNDELLVSKKVGYDIKDRAKHIYSIYNKRIARGKSINELYDLFAVRIILDTDDNNLCFLVYGMLTEIYMSVPDTFKNYISQPKNNGYQSIHTAVFGPGNKPVEVQIRTKSMDDFAERGVAAHFKYKRGLLPAKSVLEDKKFDEWMDTVRNIFENIGDETPEELLQTVKRNLFQDEIYVFTPALDFKTMPKDSTPLDFAYYVHTNIGEHCIGAKVNGTIVPLNYKLKQGDQVDILTSQNQHPTEDWLKIAVTQRARSYIIKYLNDSRKKLIIDGRNTWNSFSNRWDLKIKEENLKNLYVFFGYSSIDDLYFNLGNGGLSVEKLVNYFELSQNNHYNNKKNSLNLKYSPANVSNGLSNLLSKFPGISKDNIKFASCCKPLPGDNIVGVVEQGKLLTVHRQNCKKNSITPENIPTSVFSIDWNGFAEKLYTTKLNISGEDKPELIHNITTIIQSLDDTQIKGLNFSGANIGFQCSVTIEIKSLQFLNNLIVQLKTIDGIKTVERVFEE